MIKLFSFPKKARRGYRWFHSSVSFIIDALRTILAILSIQMGGYRFVGIEGTWLCFVENLAFDVSWNLEMKIVLHLFILNSYYIYWQY